MRTLLRKSAGALGIPARGRFPTTGPRVVGVRGGRPARRVRHSRFEVRFFRYAGSSLAVPPAGGRGSTRGRCAPMPGRARRLPGPGGVGADGGRAPVVPVRGAGPLCRPGNVFFFFPARLRCPVLLPKPHDRAATGRGPSDTPPVRRLPPAPRPARRQPPATAHPTPAPARVTPARAAAPRPTVFALAPGHPPVGPRGAAVVPKESDLEPRATHPPRGRTSHAHHPRPGWLGSGLGG